MPSLPDRLKDIAHRAGGARKKRAAAGPDIDPAIFAPAGEVPERSRRLSPRGKTWRASLKAGVDLGAGDRAGTFLQVDRSVLCSGAGRGYGGQVEVLPVSEALAGDKDLRKRWWSLVEPDADKYTALNALAPAEGYYLRVLSGRKLSAPVQACLLMSRGGTFQSVHNVIVAEEGSRAHVITGCTAHPGNLSGLHVGVSEFFVGRGASLTFTMVHAWGEGFHVRPRSTAVVEEGGTFVSNYILLDPVGSLQMYPSTVLRGRGSRARFQALLYGRGGAVLDIGNRTVLEGENSRSETVSRAIASDRSTIIARGRMTARTDSCRAHLECRGMLTSPESVVRAVPELEADGVPGAELSHEAAISPIAEEEISYLMSRGLGREEAVSVIVRGFLSVDLLGLPPFLERRIDAVLAGTPPEAPKL